jgi:hypothetical protein
MQELNGMIQQKFWVRGLIFLAVASVIILLAIAIMLPDIRIRAARFVGWLPMQLSLWLLPPDSPHSGAAMLAVWFAPAIVVGAVIGWLTYNMRWWLAATGVLVVLSFASMFLSI